MDGKIKKEKLVKQVFAVSDKKALMARSQTSGKKDREKKKQERRKEKALRKEDRKANSNKGKGFDDMIAYVDEHGRLSSTPPDPFKRSTVNAEDIEIGVPRQKPAEPEELVRTGTVTFFNESKGYGFIRDSVNGESVFVHINSLSAPVKENDKVTFEVGAGHKGPAAVNVRLIS